MTSNQGVAVVTGSWQGLLPEQRLKLTTLIRHIVIASGAQPMKLDIPGEENIVNSDQFMELDELPSTIYTISTSSCRHQASYHRLSYKDI
jgi:pyruvate/2-oxoglutarate dehydrogenase complex dihydrolipoamide dehydrogenase (E3) component